MPSGETRALPDPAELAPPPAAAPRVDERSAGSGVLGAAVFGAAPDPEAVLLREGQITPPHSRSLHLKSGAFGFRFPSRLSHIGPRHFGQVGGAAGFGLGGVIGAVEESAAS